jgi:hypothetical protein
MLAPRGKDEAGVTYSSHTLPTGLPPKLDLRRPPEGRAGRHYLRLLYLLDMLGAAIDAKEVDRTWVRSWERAVLDLLQGREIDVLMQAPDAAEFSLADLPHQRWLNLRRLLMRRKGLPT